MFPYRDTAPVIFVMYGNEVYSTSALALGDTDKYKYSPNFSRLGGYINALIIGQAGGDLTVATILNY